MKALGRALVSFVRRPAVAMACVSLMEHALSIQLLLSLRDGKSPSENSTM